MELRYIKNGLRVVKGDRVKTFRGDWVEVDSFEEPRHSGSTGRVYVKHVAGGRRGQASEDTDGYFPTVIGAEWRDR